MRWQLVIDTRYDHDKFQLIIVNRIPNYDPKSSENQPPTRVRIMKRFEALTYTYDSISVDVINQPRNRDYAIIYATASESHESLSQSNSNSRVTSKSTALPQWECTSEQNYFSLSYLRIRNVADIWASQCRETFQNSDAGDERSQQSIVKLRACLSAIVILHARHAEVCN
jgi:hypothetical protein